jgi:hypothetical protein
VKLISAIHAVVGAGARQPRFFIARLLRLQLYLKAYRPYYYRPYPFFPFF